MKRLGLILALAAAVTAFAQPSGPSQTGISASLLNMFGETKAFSSKGEIRVTEKGGDTTTIPVSMAMRDSKLRVEMDMSEMKSAKMPAQAAAMLKQTGMDRMQMLINGTGSTLIIYPGIEAYAPVPEEKLADQGKVESADIGNETVMSHPCVKRKLTFTDAKGKKEEAFVWAATDLKNFPLKIEMQQSGKAVQIQYSAPSLETPDAKLFEPPAGYTKYDSIQGLMQGAMMKMMGR